ncbi:MAG: DUF2986 domain-containing protein [Sulfurovum sp.]|nr:DUF2986 domain-containing protein [Sulfurovum sp.]
MNRQAKLQKMYDKRRKRASAKLKTSSKTPYISKADRAKVALENATVEADTEKSGNIKETS